MLNYLQTVDKYTIRENLIFRLEIPDENKAGPCPQICISMAGPEMALHFIISIRKTCFLSRPAAADLQA
jgi:hypothetical protein